MNKLKKIYTIILFAVCTNIYCQTITPQVINSAGGNWLMSNGITVSDNIGEPFVSTIANSTHTITQGFLQAFKIGAFFNVTEQHNGISCKDKNDGKISLAITSNISTYTVNYIWTPNIICPNNNCQFLDSLKPGEYSVKIKITYLLNNQLKIDSSNQKTITINDINGPCKVKIYSGITANGDGQNDVLLIDNITDFPNNHILIYNRWGTLMYEENGYDNITKFWPRKEDNSKLASTTYFYVLDLGDGSNLIKGWVELFKD